MNSVYIGNNRVLVKTIWGRQLIVHSDDLSLSSDLILNGSFDINLTNYLLKNLKPGQTFFDIGANLGYFTVLAAQIVGRNGRVISYEPNPGMYRLLQDNIGMNWMGEIITAISKAAYHREDSLTFKVYDKFHDCSSLYDRGEKWFNDYHENYKEITIEAEPLDRHFDSIDRIHLVKIDVEGAEHDVFKGFERFINSKKVDSIVFEWNQPMLGKSAQKLFDYLNELKAQRRLLFFTIDGRGDKQVLPLDQLINIEFITNVVMVFTD
jgi:FkbM family methyltransferase